MFKRLFLKVVSVAIRLVVVLVLALFASPVIPARADSSVCGPITVDTTWTSAGNNYIVTCDVQVLVGVTLTIENGVSVKFNNATGLRIDGELIATGVTFTSSSLTPTRGIWKNIYFTAGSGPGAEAAPGHWARLKWPAPRLSWTIIPSATAAPAVSTQPANRAVRRSESAGTR
ncbi:MAG: hypothetical protein MUC85_12115 [Anaerolineales bacterium]|nr:hypothetical protein [Anaerolineales bacterium]